MKSPDYVRPGRLSKERPSRFGTRTTRILALALALAFVVGACDAYAQGAGGGSDGSGGSGGSGGDLTLRVTAPTVGATVSIPFEVRVETSVPIGPTESGNHHLHLYFDGATASGEYDVVEANPVQVTRELAPGEHTIIVSLRNADHSDAGASQTITVVVAGSGGGGGSSPVPSATPADYGY